MGGFALRQPHTRGARAFAVANFAAFIWMVGDILTRLSRTASGQMLGEVVRFAGIPALPVAVFVFTRQYCGQPLRRATIAWLSSVPVLSWLMVLTNARHGLFWSALQARVPGPPETTYGPYFWIVHTPYSYGLLLLSLWTVLIEMSRAPRTYRGQLGILFAGLALALVTNAAGLFRLIAGQYTAAAVALFLALMALAIFRYHLLGGNPIAYETVFQTIRDGVIVIDRDNVIRDANPAAAAGFGVAVPGLIGRRIEDVFAPWRDAARTSDPQEVEAEYGGGTRWLAVDTASLDDGSGRILTLRDVTDRRRHEQTLESMAFCDPLTQLPNRRKFQEEAERAIAKAVGQQGALAVMYFDLNAFKRVNDTLGHDVGDELLKFVAARVRSALRGRDVLARLGGDEFAVLLHDANRTDVERVAGRIFASVEQPFTVRGNPLTANLSAGAALCPDHGSEYAALVRCADAAMYAAKARGGGLAIYDAVVAERGGRRLPILSGND